MKLGFIGTGKITSAVVTGICNSKIKYSIEYLILELHIPVTTAEVILPVPMNPSFICVFSTLNC